MKKAVWSAVGAAEGFYLIYQNPNIVSVASGVLLCSVSALIVKDNWSESAIEDSAKNVLGFFSEQKRRVSALYAIYKMAPDIAAARENFLLNAANGQSALPSEGWRQAAAETVAVANQNASVVKEIQSTNVEWVSYADQKLKNLKLGLLTSDVYSRIEGESTLLVTDVGNSEVSEKQLREYASNKISLSFWIAKKTIGESDLLVIPRHVFEQESELITKVLNRLSAEYKKTVVFVHFNVEQNAKGGLVPPSQEIISASSTTILE